MGEDIKEITQRDHRKALEDLWVFKQDIDFLDRKFFDVRLAFAGLLGVVLAIIFSNTNYFSKWFLYAILTVALLTFFSCICEIFREARGSINAYEEMERNALLANIRNIAAIHPELIQYGTKAEEIYSKENKLLNAMKNKKPIEEMLKEFCEKRKWKLQVIWWGILFLSIPILFIIHLFNL